MMRPPIARQDLRRIVGGLVIDEISRVRGPGGARTIDDPANWDDDQPFSVGGLPLDSLETLNAAAALHEMFALDQPAPDLPGRARVTLGQWLDDIAAVLARKDAFLTVMTSGSTGRRKPCAHAMRDLAGEAAWFATRVPRLDRIVALVPAHHIYGLIWTALLPAQRGVPVMAASAANLPAFHSGDLVVAVPDQWAAMLRSRRSWPARVCGVSAGAPLDDAVAEDLRAAGLHCLYDVYGSSETGGIALREAPDPAYVLLPRWRFAAPVDADAPVLIDPHGAATPLPDRLVIAADHSFSVVGRRDGAVQVGAVTVWPDQVAACLQSCPGVAAVAVRLGDHGRLKAFVVPAEAGGDAALLDRLRRHALRLSRSEQRPASYSFGAALPRSALGKLCDW